MLQGLITSVLPKAGKGVRKIVLRKNKALNNTSVYTRLRHIKTAFNTTKPRPSRIGVFILTLLSYSCQEFCSSVPTLKFLIYRRPKLVTWDYTSTSPFVTLESKINSV